MIHWSTPRHFSNLKSAFHHWHWPLWLPNYNESVYFQAIFLKCWGNIKRLKKLDTNEASGEIEFIYYDLQFQLALEMIGF